MSEPTESSDRSAGSADRDRENGFILCEVFIPEPVLEIIHSHVPVSDVLKLRQVCQLWKKIVCRRSLWKKIFERNGLILNWSRIPDFVMENEEAWKDLFRLTYVFTKNLVQNHSGHERFAHWKTNSEGHCDKITFESPPEGVSPLPADPKFNGEVDSAFVTSYGWCAIRQEINLREVGLTPEIMSAMVPFQFVMTAMVGIRFDCGGTYSACLELLDSDSGKGRYTVNDGGSHEAGEDWIHTSCALNILEQTQLHGVRHLVVMFQGKDQRFWAGHYGPKFSRITITTRCLSPQEVENMPLHQPNTNVLGGRFFGHGVWGDESDSEDIFGSEDDDIIGWGWGDEHFESEDEDGYFESGDDYVELENEDGHVESENEDGHVESENEDGHVESENEDGHFELEDEGSGSEEPPNKRRLVG